MRNKKVFWLFIIMLVSVSTLSACSNSNKDSDKNKATNNKSGKNEVNFVEAQEIPSLDPSLATDTVSFLVLNNVMEGLYRLGENDKLEEGLAVGDPEVSEDGTVLTFELRDAKWSNGDAITANDFVYAWQRIVNPETKAEYSYMMSPVKNADEIVKGELDPSELGIRAIDDKHLEVTLTNIVPYFKDLLSFASFYPQNQKFVEEQGNKFGTESTSVLYNGPFVLSSWKHEEGWTYEKNPNYWDNKEVKLDKINVKVVKDNNTSVNLYTTGDLDYTGLISEQVAKFKDRSDFGTFLDPSTYFLRFNQKNPVFANVNVRKAIAMGYDKGAFVEELLNNGSEVADFLVPKGFVTDENDVDFRKKFGDMNSYNAEKALEHWEKAKEELGQTEISVSLLNYDTESSRKVGEYLKEQLQTNLPGLTVDLKNMPFKQKLELESNLDYDFSFAGWGADYPDPMTFLDMFVTGGGHNQMNFSNSEYDSLIAQSKSDLLGDLSERWTAMQNAEKILIEDEQAIGPIYQKGVAYLRNPKLKNLFTHNFGGDYSYKWMYLED